MAGYNSVPLGEAGTGAAYLLGGSKALQRWMQRDDENAQIRKYNKSQEIQRRDQANKNYNANQIKGVPNQYWNAELNKYLNNWREIGAKYMAQGFDPFNPNPNDQNQVEASQQFIQDKSAIEQMMEAQKGFAKDIDARDKDLKKNPYGYDKDDFNPYDFEKNNTLLDLSQGKAKVPQLVGAFDYNKNVRNNIGIISKDVKKQITENGQTYDVNTVDVDMPRLVRTVKNLYATGAPRQYLEKKIGGSIDGIMGTTDETQIRKRLESEFKSPTEFNPIVELKMQGKIPSYGSPEYKAFFEDSVKEQQKVEQIYKDEINRGVEEGISKVNPKYSKQPNFDYEKMQMAAERLELAKAKKDAKGEKESLPTYRQDLLNRMIDEEVGSGEEMFESIKSGVIAKGGVLKDNFKRVKNKDGTITISIPTVYGKVNDDGKNTIERGKSSYTYDPKNREEAARKLNTILNVYSDEKIPQSAVLTPQGKKKVPGGQSEKEFSSSTYKAGGKSYSHADLIKMGYTEDQIKQALKIGSLKK